MTASVLFLGNSHLSAYKLAYDELRDSNIPECMFFCARGADLAFTEVVSGKMRPVPRAELSEEEIWYFYQDGHNRKLIELYSVQKQPLEDVRRQFVATGGIGEIDLANVAVVFYAVGVSPYDFIRLRERIAPVSRSLRRQLLGRMFGEKFLLRRQVEEIRRFRPDSNH